LRESRAASPDVSAKMRLMRRVARAAGLAGLLLAQCPSAFALNTAFDVSQYAHTSWKIRDGFAKGTIVAIAQTPDGYIWLGTDVGLLRFDGVRTVPWQPPSGQHLPSDQIFALTVTRDGTLWIGTSKGLARWKAGKFTHQVEMAGRYVSKVLEDREGSVWIARESRVPPEWQLCEMRDSRVRCLGDDSGPGVGASGLYEDSRSNLWVGTLSGLWRWKPGPSEFYPLSMPNGIQGLAEDNDGTLLVSHIGGLKRFVDGKAEMTYSFPPATQSLQFPKLLRDRDGGLWAGSALGGAVVHVHRGITDVFGQADGLSGSVVNALFEDREGSVWVATSEGLDRFRDTSAATLSVGQGLSNAYISSVLATQDGSVWAGTSEGLNRWTDGHVTVYRERNSLTREETGRRASRMVREVTDSGIPAGGVASIFEDSLGRVWVSTIHRGLGYIQNDRFTPLAGVPGGITRAIVEDKAGILWIADQDSGLFRVSPHTTEVRKIPWATLSDQGTPSAVVADRKDSSTWVGFRRGGVAHVFGDKIREFYSVSNGMPSGKIQHLWLDADDTLWAATDGGLSRIRNGRVATLTSANGLPCDGVEWGVEDDDHAFWLATPCGVVRISHGELNTWALAIDEHRPLNRVLQTTIFDSSDGVRTYIGANYYTAPAVRSRDGRLWYMSPEGLGVIDPRHLPFNNLPPPVHIERITANRKAYEVPSTADGLVSLPALVRDLEIDYTALSLVAPEKNRFRYELEGFDRDWQDVGNRRQAFYTNLPPRNYRFRVIASNNSGVWNEAGASLDFSIVPAYYQTLWFRLSVVAAFLSLLGALYQLRQRQIVRQFNMRLEERVNERTRIARDLHDTLLQSLHGVLLRFQSAAILLPDRPVDAQKALASGIDQAAEALAEGRDAVQGLRSSVGTTTDLTSLISAIGEELAAARTDRQSIDFRVQVEGTPRDLGPLIQDDVYRIAREALRNAYRHASATRIVVEIRYDARQFRLRVRDNGKGMDQKIVDEGGRAGHYGLPGMRERVKLLRGTLTIWSELDSGTEIELTIPSLVAYAKASESRSSTASEGI